jgi:hypothetical protein
VPVALAWMIFVVGVSAQDAAGQDEVDRRSEPATLSIWNRPIVTLRATVGGNEPAQRVQNARRRLGDLSEQELALPVAREAAHLAGNEGFAVTIGGRALFGVVEGDVDAESGLTVTQLAEQAEARLRDVIAAHIACGHGARNSDSADLRRPRARGTQV